MPNEYTGHTAEQAAPTTLAQTAHTLEETLDDATRQHHPRHHSYHHVDVNCSEKSFVAGLTVYNLLWVFIVASIIGVFSETLFLYLKTGQWMRTTGMLYGPFNQIYGFGAVLLTLLLYKLRHRNFLVIVLAAAVIGMVFEYIASWVQQLMFGSTSWDYTGMVSSIGGRTNLLFGLGWGLMGYVFIAHFWPWMTEMSGRIPNKIGRPLTIVISLLLAVNLALSGAAVWRQSRRAAGMPATNAVTRFLDATYPDSVMQEKYPSMRFSK